MTYMAFMTYTVFMTYMAIHDILLTFLLGCNLWPPWAFAGNVTSSEVISNTLERASSTNIFQGQYLPVPFTVPIPTNIFCGANTYQYSLQGHYLSVLYSIRRQPA